MAGCFAGCFSGLPSWPKGSRRKKWEIQNQLKDDADRLSYIGKAAYDKLRNDYSTHWQTCWNVTSGNVIGTAKQTPYETWPDPFDPPCGHDDWFPEAMAELMGKTTHWLDVTSLSPPDGLFLKHMKDAIAKISETANSTGVNLERPIIIRILFGNIIGAPVNCTTLIKDLTSGIENPDPTRIQIWVGAWRKGLSWNHSKIIAVDGRYLFTGGHNLWDEHYLKKDPIHDLSMEAEGRVTHDGHLFANKMWKFIKETHERCLGSIIDKFPDSWPMPCYAQVTVSEFPEGVNTFPPLYEKREDPSHLHAPHHVTNGLDRDVPIVSIGRYGSLLTWDRPSDHAIIAMFNEAKMVIHLAQQDIGPPCLPDVKIAIPGCTWPKEYLTALGLAIYQRGVDVEIALSNPHSTPNNLPAAQACYSNGWSCADVASEIIKAIQAATAGKINDERLRQMVEKNLRVCYIKQAVSGKWRDENNMGMHAKHFIIDDRAYYIGSQNLYVCDLAEWGLLIDDPVQTQKIMKEYWTPMWKNSYTERDCDVDEVMNGLDVDRDGESLRFKGASAKREAAEKCVRLLGATDHLHT